MDGDTSQFIDVVGTDSQAAPIIHESGTPPHPDSQPPDDGSQCLDVSDGDGGEGQGMDDSVIVIPGSPRRVGGGGRERDVSIIDISDSSKVGYRYQNILGYVTIRVADPYPVSF